MSIFSKLVQEKLHGQNENLTFTRLAGDKPEDVRERREEKEGWRASWQKRMRVKVGEQRTSQSRSQILCVSPSIT